MDSHTLRKQTGCSRPVSTFTARCHVLCILSLVYGYSMATSTVALTLCQKKLKTRWFNIWTPLSRHKISPKIRPEAAQACVTVWLSLWPVSQITSSSTCETEMTILSLCGLPANAATYTASTPVSEASTSALNWRPDKRLFGVRWTQRREFGGGERG